MNTPEHTIADALGQLLLRDTRQGLYASLTAGIDGVDATTYPVLSGLARLGETTSSELAARVGLDRSVTSRHAAALERAGLVERHAHDRDRRANTLALTRAGHAAIELTRQRLDQHLRTFLQMHTTNDAERLALLLPGLVDYLRNPQDETHSRNSPAAASRPDPAGP